MNDTTLRTVFLIAEEIGEGGRGGDSGWWWGGGYKDSSRQTSDETRAMVQAQVLFLIP